MADNVELNSMTGGSTVAADDISSVWYQRVKVTLGADGVNDGDVSSSNKMPVVDSAITTVLGEVQASPTANTVLARLKLIEGYLDGVEALLTTIDNDTGAIATSLAIIDNWDNAASDGASVSGDTAHDAADAGEPVKLGAHAIDHGANPTEVADDDRTDLYANRAGVPWVIGGHPHIQTKNLNVSDADGAQTDTAIVSVSAGEAIVVTLIDVLADEATTAGTQCRIGFGATNTPALDAAGVILSHSGIAPGSGVVKGTGAGIVGQGASGEDLRVTCEDPAGGNLDITVSYYTIAIG